MIAGSVFFDSQFTFYDGVNGEKLFIVLGCLDSIYVVAKTTSNGSHYSSEHGCQPDDRFHNFYLAAKTCPLNSATWVCLNELYELKQNETLKKSFAGQIKPVCSLDTELVRELQDCALFSDDTTVFQQKAIEANLAA